MTDFNPPWITKPRIPADQRPICIWHKGDAKAYYAASKENQAAWNAYAEAEAERFQENLGAYETIHGYIGRDRDGRITDWCPPLFFPEWLIAKHEKIDKKGE